MYFVHECEFDKDPHENYSYLYTKSVSDLHVILHHQTILPMYLARQHHSGF